MISPSTPSARGPRWSLRPSPLAAQPTIPFAVAALGWLAAYVVGAMFVASLLTSLVGDVKDPSVSALLVGLVGMWAVFIAVLIVISRHFGSNDFRRDYALGFSPRDLVMIPLGIALQFALPITYWPLQKLWPTTFSDDALSERAHKLIDGAHGVSLILLVLAVTIGAPLVEELMYRGLLQRSLSGRWSPVAAWVAASAWFALIHQSGVELLGLFLAGLLFGAGYLFTGRLGPGIIAHFAFNATGLAMAYHYVPQK